jgi:hypothetical protein
MQWDTEFHGAVEIENPKAVNQACPSAAEENFVDSVDSTSALHKHTAEINNPTCQAVNILSQEAPLEQSNAVSWHDHTLMVYIVFPTTEEGSFVSFVESTTMDTFWSDILA